MKLANWFRPIPPIIRAVRTGTVEELEELIQCVEDVNACDRRGASPLHHAALHVWPDAVKALLAAGADPTIVDHQGHTAAHVAAQYGRTENLQILIDAGCPCPELAPAILLSPMSCHLPRTP